VVYIKEELKFTRYTESSKYWEERQRHNELVINRDTDVTVKRMFKTYKKTEEEINNDINKFLIKITNNEGKLDSILANQFLSPEELRDYKKLINGLIKEYRATKNPRALADITRILNNFNLSRLAALDNILSCRLGILANFEENQIYDHLTKSYEKNYRQVYTDLKKFGVKQSYFAVGINENIVRRAVNQNWSGDYFSTDIWRNKGRLVGSINKTIREGLTTGKSTQRMARELRYRTDNIYFNANRLIRTETNYILNESTRQSYLDFGVEKYEFLAEIDSRTSKACFDLDKAGKIYELKDAKIGTNYPPIHPFAGRQ
jgi:SPP1 gp7 family putative phage head morphogenesis protein